jgi:phage baseplate assembly protein W
MATYKGFSTVNIKSQKNFRLTDFDLIKQDLLNILNTPKGSRLMLPNEGCIVWSLLYEPLTAQMKQEIAENLKEIVNVDPRVSLIGINFIDSTDKNTLNIDLSLLYTATNQVDSMRLNFDIAANLAS